MVTFLGSDGQERPAVPGIRNLEKVILEYSPASLVCAGTAS